jgi:hypothetical protein
MNATETLIQYLDATRQSGHTHLMMNGVISSKKCVILVHNMDMAKNLKERWDLGKGAVFVSLNNLDALRGLKLPLAIDNAALHTLFFNSLSEVEELKRKNAALTDRNNKLVTEVEELEEKLCDAKQKSAILETANNSLTKKFNDITKIVRQ